MQLHSEFTEFFRQIAINHKEIAHTDENCHFARLIRSGGDFDFLYVEEFENLLRSRMKPVCLLVESYTAKYGDNGHDYRYKMPTIAFVILDKPVADNFDDVERILDKTERIAEEILAYVKYYFEKNWGSMRTRFNSASSEKIGPVEGFFGTRVEMTFEKASNPSFVYNPDKWLFQ